MFSENGFIKGISHRRRGHGWDVENILQYVYEGFVSATPMISQVSDVAHNNPGHLFCNLLIECIYFFYFNQTLQEERIRLDIISTYYNND